MKYRLAFRSYRRPFGQPLQTHHGNWCVREGVLLRLEDEDGQVGFGEVAPLPWFGSEPLEQALNFCQHMVQEMAQGIPEETILSIPSTLPACRFGFESAIDNPKSKIQNPKSKISYSGLLPAGRAAVEQWRTLWAKGYRTFKWKIGVAPIQEELAWFKQLTHQLGQHAVRTGSSVRLRLDANGGLMVEDAEQWLENCDRAEVPIEFLEQPLPVEQFEAMVRLSEQYTTPLALDESVATLTQLQTCYERGWRGVFTIKPAIAGSPIRLRQLCQKDPLDIVFSSVFETSIGRRAILDLAADIQSTPWGAEVDISPDRTRQRPNRALGFGTQHWFCENDPLDDPDPERLWQALRFPP